MKNINSLFQEGHVWVVFSMEKSWVWYLTSTAASDDAIVPNGSFYNHDGVVKTSFHFCNELLGTSS